MPNPGPGETVTVVFYGTNLLKPDQEKLARAFLEAMRRAANELQTSEQIFAAENLAIWNQYTNVAEERILKSAPYTYTPNLGLNVQSVLDQQQQLLRAGRLEYREALPESRLIDTRFQPRR